MDRDLKYPKHLDAYLEYAPRDAATCYSDICDMNYMLVSCKLNKDESTATRILGCLSHLRYRYIILTNQHDVDSCAYRRYYELKLPKLKWRAKYKPCNSHCSFRTVTSKDLTIEVVPMSIAVESICTDSLEAFEQVSVSSVSVCTSLCVSSSSVNQNTKTLSEQVTGLVKDDPLVVCDDDCHSSDGLPFIIDGYSSPLVSGELSSPSSDSDEDIGSTILQQEPETSIITECDAFETLQEVQYVLNGKLVSVNEGSLEISSTENTSYSKSYLIFGPKRDITISWIKWLNSHKFDSPDIVVYSGSQAYITYRSRGDAFRVASLYYYETGDNVLVFGNQIVFGEKPIPQDQPPTLASLSLCRLLSKFR